MQTNLAGYSHPAYAASLAEFGLPRGLPRSGGTILERPLADSPWRDAMGCYPLFFCLDWAGLAADVDELYGKLLSLVLVAVPSGQTELDALERAFRGGVRPFKTHQVADLSSPAESFVNKHHRYYARRALKNVAVERCKDPSAWLQDWIRLYSHLVERRGLRGVQAFSPRAFEAQLSIPGLVMFRAVAQGRTVAAHLWYVQADTAFSHLAAADAEGYELMAPYALYWFALKSLVGEVRMLNLGGGAGLEEADDGLSRFKRGWASGTRTAYLATRVLDPAGYEAACAAHRAPRGEGYFPAYRGGRVWGN